MSMSDNQGELIIGCITGLIIRCGIRDLNAIPASSSHTSPISSVAFGDASRAIFATGTETGEIRVWDISDYACLAFIR